MNMNRQTTFLSLGILILLLLSSVALRAQEATHISLGGYIQGLLQTANSDRYISVGTGTSPYGEQITRIGIRRGRLSATAAYGDLSAKIEINGTDQKISMHQVYTTYSPKWGEGLYFKGGLYNVDFGYELPYSSSKRVTFEKALYFSDLFPGDTDMHLAIGYKGSLDLDRRWKIETSLAAVAGNGNKGMIKSLPDVSSRIALSHRNKNFHVGFGVSGYWGLLPTTGGYYHYTSSTPSHAEGKAMRLYYGAFVDSSIRHAGGTLSLMAEGIAGQQPGSQDSNKAAAIQAKSSAEGILHVQRPFIACSAQIAERLSAIPLELFAKYAYYDRNTRLDAANAPQGLEPKTESSSIQAEGGVNDYLRQDHLRLSLHYLYVHDAKPTHMATLGVQYTF